MIDILKNSGRVSPRPGLYCVWIRASEGENAPLVSVWIDPSMAIFESEEEAQQSDDAGGRIMAHGAVLKGGVS
jgi:hypothetical protein